MARRKKEDPVEALLKLLVIIAVGGGYYVTKSWTIAILGGSLVLIGYLILAMYQSHKKKQRLRASGIEEIDKMNGYLFEDYLKELFQQLGYQVKATPSAGDYGADLVLIKGNSKIVVQAKRYTQKVGLKAVQEIYSSIHHYQANEAWVVTNSFYTAQAQKLAKSNGVKLLDRENLIELILQTKGKKVG